MTSTLDALRACVDSGALTHDSSQEEAAHLLAALNEKLRDWPPKRGFRLFGRGEEPARPKGVWLHGPVGTGKSMLMEMFFSRAPVEKKRRVHFHDFMAEAHGAIAEWRSLDPAERRRRDNYVKGAGEDPIPPTAKALAGGARLLCLDEAEITDIADAMLVGRLFEQIFERGTVLVATSNRAPEELYLNGVNRQLFLPFIDLIGERLDVVRLDAGRDYRRRALEGEDLWLTPVDGDTRARFDELWSHMTAGAGEHEETLTVSGRAVRIPRAANACARFGFETLCGSALGASDYLAIARRYRAVFLEDVPVMGAESRDKARRFVTLIDALYEEGGALVALAEAEPDALYEEGDYAFEFRRAASRIAELRRNAAPDAGTGLASDPA